MALLFKKVADPWCKQITRNALGKLQCKNITYTVHNMNTVLCHGDYYLDEILSVILCVVNLNSLLLQLLIP